MFTCHFFNYFHRQPHHMYYEWIPLMKYIIAPSSSKKPCCYCRQTITSS